MVHCELYLHMTLGHMIILLVDYINALHSCLSTTTFFSLSDLPFARSSHIRHSLLLYSHIRQYVLVGHGVYSHCAKQPKGASDQRWLIIVNRTVLLRNLRSHARPIALIAYVPALMPLTGAHRAWQLSVLSRSKSSTSLCIFSRTVSHRPLAIDWRSASEKLCWLIRRRSLSYNTMPGVFYWPAWVLASVRRRSIRIIGLSVPL
jgi:hypothetical protein